jgi:two-component system response regulator (stage 0 sporulation protein A)
MLKLLIADATEETRQALEELFQQRCAVKTCIDGEAALELLQTFAPDILVLNLMLPKVDGLSVLQQLRQRQMPTMVLVQTAIDSPYVMNRLHQLGAEYVVRMPCLISALQMQILDFMQQLQDTPPQTHCEDLLVTSLLMQMGFSTKLAGYSYLADAIPLYARDPSQAITKELYVAVGQLHRKDPILIERSIRSAIDKAWREGDQTLWQKYFRCLPDGTVERPSNGHFITRMAQLLMGRTHESAIA